ncbi:hypothetical protein C0993_001758, partial [Termitomyces sp. T159_Od127]
LPPMLIKQGWPMQLQFFLVMTATSPRDSKPPKTTPTPLPAPERYPDNPSATPGHHWPSPPPATATPGIPLAITAMTATSVLALAITPPINATSALAVATPNTPWPMPRPPSHITITHHRRPNLCMPCLASAPLLTALPPHVYAFPVQDLHAA